MYDDPWRLEVILEEFERPYVVLRDGSEDYFWTSDYRRAEQVCNGLNLLASYED